MAPKKGQKMSLNAFLEDSTLGSWADEMDALPTAPAPRTDEDRARMNDRGFDRRDRDFSSRPERQQPAREELPLPTEPPYTAFVGNLPFDLAEDDLADFFAPAATKSIKIIRDRDDKPKGFGYVEFEELDGLKDALSKSGANMQNRAIRVSVAAPPQKGAGFGDDDKTAGPWRRDGPLPDRPTSRSRFDDGASGTGRFREDKPPSLAESASDWRSSRAPQPPPRFEDAPRPARRSGVSTPVGEPSAADLADDWTIGSKFKAAPSPAPDAPPRGRFGSVRSDRGDFSTSGAPRREPSASDGVDWRSIMRPRQDSQEKSPSSSTPPTPNLGRRKLELIPRNASQANSTVNSPLSSPKMPSAGATPRSNPFGAAKPVDVSARETAAAQRVEKEREELSARVEKQPMFRSASKQAAERPKSRDGTASSPTVTTAPALPQNKEKEPGKVATAVRSTFSFANAAGSKGKKDVADIQESQEEEQKENGESSAIKEVTDKVAEIAV